MYVAKEDGAFVMTLYDGYQYAEADAQGRPNTMPFMISHFKEWTRRFDLAEFDLDRTEEEQFKTHQTMKSARQIAYEIDTLNEQIQIARTANRSRFALLSDTIVEKAPAIKRTNTDTTKERMLEAKKLQGKRAVAEGDVQLTKYKDLKTWLDTADISQSPSLIQELPVGIRHGFISQLHSKITIAQSTQDRGARTIDRLEINRRKHIYELHWKFSLAAACIVMLLIGGPMGTIVRKGGFGYPLLVSIFFFTFFIMSNISCKKLNDSEKLPPVLAAWLPVILLAAISAVLTYKALHDSKIMDLDRFRARLTKWINFLKREKAV